MKNSSLVAKIAARLGSGREENAEEIYSEIYSEARLINLHNLITMDQRVSYHR